MFLKCYPLRVPSTFATSIQQSRQTWLTKPLDLYKDIDPSTTDEASIFPKIFGNNVRPVFLISIRELLNLFHLLLYFKFTPPSP